MGLLFPPVTSVRGPVPMALPMALSSAATHGEAACVTGRQLSAARRRNAYSQDAQDIGPQRCETALQSAPRRRGCVARRTVRLRATRGARGRGATRARPAGMTAARRGARSTAACAAYAESVTGAMAALVARSAARRACAT